MKTQFSPSFRFLVTANEGEIQLPSRATLNSAGYDFLAPEDFTLKPGEKKLIFTNVKAKLRPDQWLLLAINSGRAIKEGIVLANQIAVIDADYQDNVKTDGNIGICLLNTNPEHKLIPNQMVVDGTIIDYVTMEDLTEKNTFTFKKGESIAQGIVMSYQTMDIEDKPTKVRAGGFGHTREHGGK